MKNDETRRLADESVRLTGETGISAITVALRERPEGEKRLRDVNVGVDESVAIGQRCARLLAPDRATAAGPCDGSAACAPGGRCFE